MHAGWSNSTKSIVSKLCFVRRHVNSFLAHKIWKQKYSKKQGLQSGAVIGVVTVTSKQEVIGFESRPEPFCVEFTCSAGAAVSFLLVSPTVQKQAGFRLSGDSKLSVGGFSPCTTTHPIACPIIVGIGSSCPHEPDLDNSNRMGGLSYVHNEAHQLWSRQLVTFSLQLPGWPSDVFTM